MAQNYLWGLIVPLATTAGYVLHGFTVRRFGRYPFGSAEWIRGICVVLENEMILFNGGFDSGNTVGNGVVRQVDGVPNSEAVSTRRQLKSSRFVDHESIVFVGDWSRRKLFLGKFGEGLGILGVFSSRIPYRREQGAQNS